MILALHSQLSVGSFRPSPPRSQTPWIGSESPCHLKRKRERRRGREDGDEK